MADSAVSWFLLAAVGIFLMARFLYSVIMEDIRIKQERERESNEFFLELSLDKVPKQMYNKRVKRKEVRRNEYYDD